jgi:crotonobetainyl-CoA:carnitine CoA-transferase CaiB-like acyl-CoA transferase
MTMALDGIKVLELCGERGQLMGKLMGDMGATVIKIEPIGGVKERNIGPFKDDIPNKNRSLYFWANNTSKQSVELDITSSEGSNILKNLSKNVDIILEDMKPGYLTTLGLDYTELSKENPALIMTSLTAFGQDGPYRDYKSTDIVALAMGGQMHSCGYDDLPGSPPIRPWGDHGNYIASHYALLGTLSALIYRDLSGKGQYIDASAHEACSSTTEAALPTYLYSPHGVVSRQTGRHHAVTPTSKTLCKTVDGKYLIVFRIFMDLSSWISLVKWMDSYGMAEDLGDQKFKDMAARRTAGSEDADYAMEVLRKFITTQTAEDVYRKAQQLRFPWGIVRSPEENLNDPHFSEDRGMFAEIAHPELGKDVLIKYVGRPYNFKGTPWNATRPPLSGEHTEAILENELNYSSDQLNSLVSKNIIGSA